MRIASLALVASAVVADSANAVSDFYDFSNYCSGTSFATCASIQFYTVQLPSGGTIIQVWLRNLQGTHPASQTGPVAGWQVIMGSNTVRMWDDRRNALYNGSLAVGSVGAGPDSEVDVYNEDYWDYAGYQHFLFYPQIAGCQAPWWFGQPGGDGWQTCDAKGYTGWAVYQFTIPRSIHASQMYFAWADTEAYDLACGAVGGVVDPTPSCRHLPLSSVPEPETVGLVAIGLVGLGVTGFRRRRDAAASR
ncbi:MAG: PEP-CTERM sorting domain-containing protein [Gemmatimonadales bacterium]